MLGDRPTSEDRSKYNMKIVADLFTMLCSAAAAAGPFQTLLQNLARELRPFLYSTDQSFDQSVQTDLPHMELVSRLKRDKERISATLVSATAALTKCERDTTKLAAANKKLETTVATLEQQLQSTSSDSSGTNAAYGHLQVHLRPCRPCLPAGSRASLQWSPATCAGSGLPGFLFFCGCLRVWESVRGQGEWRAEVGPRLPAGTFIQSKSRALDSSPSFCGNGLDCTLRHMRFDSEVAHYRSLLHGLIACLYG
jgi:hypothetical protein